MKKSPEEVFEMCKSEQQKGIGKIKVGAVCHGMKFIGAKVYQKYFSGANVHVSDSFADVHAEQMVVNLALLERYYPVEVFVTSTSKEEDVMMCGTCRHYLNEINSACTVVVFNPDGSIKKINFLSAIYPYSKDVFEKNMKFRSLCDYKI